MSGPENCQSNGPNIRANMANLRDIHIYLCHTGDGVQHSGVDLISIDVLKLWHIPVLYIFLGVLSTQKKNYGHDDQNCAHGHMLQTLILSPGWNRG